MFKKLMFYGFLESQHFFKVENTKPAVTMSRGPTWCKSTQELDECPSLTLPWLSPWHGSTSTKLNQVTLWTSFAYLLLLPVTTILLVEYLTYIRRRHRLTTTEIRKWEQLDHISWVDGLRNCYPALPVCSYRWYNVYGQARSIHMEVVDLAVGYFLPFIHTRREWDWSWDW